jgi:hypothetical protein
MSFFVRFLVVNKSYNCLVEMPKLVTEILENNYVCDGDLNV